MKKSILGQSILRQEGISKVTGRSIYVDDLAINHFLYGTTIRSPLPCGILKGIAFADGFPWHEFTIVTAKDIPNSNVVFLIKHDQPYLVEKFINHAEEPVLLLAHPDKYLLEEARRCVKLEISPLESVLSLEDAERENKVMKKICIERGNIADAFSCADIIIEREYATGAQEQLYIEPNGMVARYDDGVITVWGSMQCPYYIQVALEHLFGFPRERVRVVQTETGGGFGGKEDYPSIIAGHAALLAYKSQKTVKMIYDRGEDMVATTKRHPSRTRHKTAVDKDGRLLAMDIDFAVDAGAYETLSAVVLSRGALHANSVYYCPNIRISGTAYFTNTPPNGAFRGFGAPQSIFAMERHMDEIARRLFLQPEEIRRRNFICKGKHTATGQVIRDPVNMHDLLKRALIESSFDSIRDKFALENSSNHVKRGIGLSCFLHGAGFTGAGEKYLASKVKIEVTKEAHVNILTSCTEIGQGTKTIFSQIAANALEIDCENVVVVAQDTKYVPDSGPTVASRTCMIVGQLVERAAVGIKEQLHSLSSLGVRGFILSQKKMGPRVTLKDDNMVPEDEKVVNENSKLDFKQACQDYIKKFGKLEQFAQYEQPPEISWDEDTYQGDAYPCFAWAVYVATVSVDTVTYQVKVDNFLAVQEVGRVVNPTLAEGQIEGGIVQGIGYTLYENVQWKNGKMVNNSMTNYIIPTAMDVPEIKVIFEELPNQYGPGGAKGIGELPLDGVAPAILSAIENATSASLTTIPVMPEDLMRAMETVNG